jgi:hypothetical protein
MNKFHVNVPASVQPTQFAVVCRGQGARQADHRAYDRETGRLRQRTLAHHPVNMNGRGFAAPS